MSVSRIKSDVTELKNIEKEIKRLNDLLKPLRNRKREIEEEVLKYMESTGEKGLSAIKMNDVEVVAVEKKVRERLKKDEKEQKAIQVLHQNGVVNARRAFKDLQEMMKGKECTEHKLKIKESSRDASSMYGMSSSVGKFKK